MDISNYTPAQMAKCRDDLRLWDSAIKRGWTPRFHRTDQEYKRTTKQNIPNHPISFDKNDTTVWQTSLGWRSVMTINGSTCAHYTHPTLGHALAFEYPAEARAYYTELAQLYEKAEAKYRAHKDWDNDREAGMVHHREKLRIMDITLDYTKYLAGEPVKPS